MVLFIACWGFYDLILKLPKQDIRNGFNSLLNILRCINCCAVRKHSKIYGKEEEARLAVSLIQQPLAREKVEPGLELFRHLH